MSGPEIMRTLQYFFYVISALMIWSCEVEPFEVNSLADTDSIPTEEITEDDDEPMSSLNTGEIRFNIEDRIYITDQTNGEIVNGLTTIVGEDELNGESITLLVEGERTGTYLFDQFVSQSFGTYSPGFDDMPYSTSINFGGGFVTITDVDLVDSHISGLFELTAYRESLDNEGNLIFDQFGDPVYDLVTLTEGEFYMIPIN